MGLAPQEGLSHVCLWLSLVHMLSALPRSGLNWLLWDVERAANRVSACGLSCGPLGHMISLVCALANLKWAEVHATALSSSISNSYKEDNLLDAPESDVNATESYQVCTMANSIVEPSITRKPGYSAC